jgi:ribonuclease VapC
LARRAVLDATAVLAVLFNEMGSDRVLPLLKGAMLSTVNLAEAYANLVRRGIDGALAWRRLMELGCEICAMDEEQARLAGELAGQPRTKALSLGDRACLALAAQREATVYTTDARWNKLGLEIEVAVIR